MQEFSTTGVCIPGKLQYESQNINQCYFLSFNFNQNKEYRDEELEVKNKNIFAY